MRFEWQPIRERDAEGTLIAAGVQWTELRMAAQVTCGIVVMLSFMGGVAAWLAGEVLKAEDTGMTALTFFAICGGALVGGRRMRGTVRSLVFQRDGRILAPLGFAHYPARFREVDGHIDNIVSIEARGQGLTDCSVVMFARCGDIAYVAGRLHQDSAHKVAVQLTLALAELRESLAAPAGAHKPSSRSAAEASID